MPTQRQVGRTFIFQAFRVIESSPLDQATSEKQVLGGSVFLIQFRILISVLTLYLQLLPLLHLIICSIVTPTAKLNVD